MLNNRSAYKYETSFKGPCVITQCWTNGKVTRQYGAIKIVHNIRQIKLYKTDTSVEDIYSGKMCDDVKISSLLINFYIILNLAHKVYNQATYRDFDINSYQSCT